MHPGVSITQHRHPTLQWLSWEDVSPPDEHLQRHLPGMQTTCIGAANQLMLEHRVLEQMHAWATLSFIPGSLVMSLTTIVGKARGEWD